MIVNSSGLSYTAPVMRKNNLPGKYSDEEMAQLQAKADAAGIMLAAYIRKRLGMPEVRPGAPVGNKNNPLGAGARKLKKGRRSK